MKLKEKLKEKIPEWRERVKKLVKDYGGVKVQDLTIAQVYGGMRDLKCLVSDISYVDPEEGVRMRGYTIQELLEKLPKKDEIPMLGGHYYLLLTDELPTFEDAMEVENEWKKRSKVPQYVFDMLKTIPRDTHPLTMFSLAVLTLQRESLFTPQYKEGKLKKEEYWDPMLEDSLNLTAKLPTIAAFIYRIKYKNDTSIPKPDENIDWAGNFGYMIGIKAPEYKDLIRLYLLLHADHESGPVSSHTAHLVGSGLADVYYAWSAGINGLAGPLHGLATETCLCWLIDVRDKYNGVPTKEQLEEFVWDTLNSGQVIPGYGHAVLRKTDPRFVAQRNFALKHLPESELFKIADLAQEVVPPILMKLGKVKNPWPNVDALTGALQSHYGIKECDFYTVIFGISRALGITANMIWARILGQPIERPKSVTTKMLEEIAAKAK